jgi:hypothetical protein
MAVQVLSAQLPFAALYTRWQVWSKRGVNSVYLDPKRRTNSGIP